MSELKFTRTHEWVQVGQDSMTVGITDHAQHLLGDMVFVDLPEAGREVRAGDEVGVLESVKAASDFYAPISGVVIEVNQDVVANPELVNKEPYATGWLIKIQASNPDELGHLLTAEQYENECIEE